MKSISTRLAAWYAMAATVTLACLFVVGYHLLESYLVHGLDLLNGPLHAVSHIADQRVFLVLRTGRVFAGVMRGVEPRHGG